VVVIFVFYKTRNERQIRRNISSLSTAISSILKNDGITVPQFEVLRIVSFFTEDCQITIGRPLPKIYGRQDLIAAVYLAGKMYVGEVEVGFYDVSVSIAENAATATSTKTAVATRAIGREILNIKMHWEKIQGRWKIATVESIPILH
jgi:hypothetical protein